MRFPAKQTFLQKDLCLQSKDEGTDKDIWKYGLVDYGHRDKLKEQLVHNVSAAGQHFTKLLVGTAAKCVFRLFSTDATQATSKMQKS